MSNFRSAGYGLVPGYRPRKGRLSKKQLWNSKLKRAGLEVIRPGQMTKRLAAMKRKMLAAKASAQERRGGVRTPSAVSRVAPYSIDLNEPIGVVGFGKVRPQAQTEGVTPGAVLQADPPGSSLT